jgi:drug/metabolite transporter (DMT)-like permease
VKGSTKQMYIALVLAMIVWGISWPSAKLLTEYSTALHVAFVRFCFTAVGIFIILKSIKVSFVIKKEGWHWLAIGSVLMAAYSYLFFSGLKNGLPGQGGVLVTTMTPVVSYFIALLIQKRKPNWVESIALIVGIIAACFLLHIWDYASEILKSGNIFLMLSVLVWALLSRITANSAQYGSPLAFTWWMYLFCAFILSFFSPWQNTVDLVQKADALFWWNMFFSAVINTGIATTIFFFVTSKLGAERTSMFIYIVPFAAAISSSIVYNERLYWYTVVGGLLGISAVLIINGKKMKARLFNTD